jgi:hypothetical protein
MVRSGPPLVTRRRLLTAAAPLAGVAVLGPVWSWYLEPRWVDWSSQQVVIPSLPEALEGARVVHLTDVHASAAVPLRYVRRVVDRVCRLEPDLVVITGDLVTHDSAFISGVARELGRLRGRLGTFAVLGNHDYWVDGPRLGRQLEAAGVHHLRNESVVLEGLRLLGIDDHWTGNDDLDRAMAGVGADEPSVLLMHSPDLLSDAASAGVDVALAGHTHGGQVRLPWYGALVLPSVHGFEQGWYEQGATRMYVNRGVGTLETRARLLCRPEVLELTLSRGAA